ncbi:MAG: hypothetical protein LBR64_09565 [Dysgonamonadaceae bacterium]|jgi:hypothetical protein|nr:hypothetical protein [Dysgonamonadaceae bacterium]
MKKTRFYLTISLCMTALSLIFTLASCSGSTATKEEKAAKEAVAKTEDAVDALVKDAAEKLNAKQAQESGWPKNDFTDQLPKPDLKCGISGSSTLGFSVTFDKPEKEQVKAYAKQLKDGGFSINPIEDDNDSYYMFTAENSSGYGVLLSWTPGNQSGILISKSK